MKVCSHCNVASTWMCCKVLHLVLHLLEKFNIWSKSSWKVLKKVLILHLRLVLHKIPLKKSIAKRCWYCCCTIHRWSKSADDNDSDSSDAAAAACVRVGLPELSPSTPSWAFSFHTTSLREAPSLLDPPFRLARYVFPPRPYLPVQYVFPPFSPVIICGKTPAVVKTTILANHGLSVLGKLLSLWPRHQNVWLIKKKILSGFSHIWSQLGLKVSTWFQFESSYLLLWKQNW